ncbi:MAG TPA: GNAT family N-acetyltransferase [Burkholderiales bacterium]|nr:GNAT family N-acetyltransferase [Burkholderiales bacterium]
MTEDLDLTPDNDEAMRRTHIRARVIDILSRIMPGFDPTRLAPGASLSKTLAADSMDILNLAIAFHDEFGVEIAERDYAHLDTLEGCVDLIAAARSSRADATMDFGAAKRKSFDASPVRRHRLLDGRTVTIRPLGAEDRDRERDFIAGLSGESRYLRFQRWIAASSEELIHFLTDVDPQRHVALVCTAPSEHGEDVVGEARYVLNPDGESCEFGVVLADAWRNSGIAALLMSALINAARSRGLKRMEGLVLSSNRTMLHFARAMGFDVQVMPEEPTTTRIVKRL